MYQQSAVPRHRGYSNNTKPSQKAWLPFVSVSDLHEMCYDKPKKQRPIMRTRSLQELSALTQAAMTTAALEKGAELPSLADETIKRSAKVKRSKTLPGVIEDAREDDSDGERTAGALPALVDAPVESEEPVVPRRALKKPSDNARAKKSVSIRMEDEGEEDADSKSESNAFSDSDSSEEWNGEDSDEEEARFEAQRDANSRTRATRKTNLASSADASQLALALLEGPSIADRRRASMAAVQNDELKQLTELHGEELAFMNQRNEVRKQRKAATVNLAQEVFVQRPVNSRKTIGAGGADIAKALQHLREKPQLELENEDDSSEEEANGESEEKLPDLAARAAARRKSIGTGQANAAQRQRSLLPNNRPKKELAKEIAPGLLPYCIKMMDYPTAIRFFEHADKVRAGGSTGELDKTTFFNMLVAMTRDKEQMTRKWSNQIFKAIDADDGGSIGRDEFLGWVFQTHNNYMASVRTRLEKMDPFKCKELFRNFDADGSGQMDKDEFWEFAEAFCPDEGLSRSSCDDLHEFIDKDKSGGIDIEEFLNWIHPGRALKLAMGGSDKANAYVEFERSRAATNSTEQWRTEKLIKSDGFQAPTKALMELGAKEPVVIQFTMGEEFRADLKAVKFMIRKGFDASQVKFDEVIDPMVSKTCTKVVAKIGRGITLWDRQTMLPFMEDPFENEQRTIQWLKNILETCLPDVIAAANLRTIKKRKKFIEKKKSLQSQSSQSSR